MARRQPLPAADRAADSSNLQVTTKPRPKGRVFREVSPEERALIVERFCRLLAGPPLVVDSETLREAEGDSV